MDKIPEGCFVEIEGSAWRNVGIICCVGSRRDHSSSSLVPLFWNSFIPFRTNYVNDFGSYTPWSLCPSVTAPVTPSATPSHFFLSDPEISRDISISHELP